MTVKFKMLESFSLLYDNLPLCPRPHNNISYKGQGGKEAHGRVTVVLSIVMIAVLVMRNTYIWVSKGGPSPRVFPAPDLASPAASCSSSPAVRDKYKYVAQCLNFPAGLICPIIFADGLEASSPHKCPQTIAYHCRAHAHRHHRAVHLLTGLIRIDRRSLLKMLRAGRSVVLSVLSQQLVQQILHRRRQLLLLLQTRMCDIPGDDIQHAGQKLHHTIMASPLTSFTPPPGSGCGGSVISW